MQLDLFTPATSQLSLKAHAESGKLATNRQIVLNAIREWPGRTSAELASIIDMERHEVARRASELIEPGLVRQGERRKCKTNGRAAFTWWAVEVRDGDC